MRTGLRILSLVCALVLVVVFWPEQARAAGQVVFAAGDAHRLRADNAVQAVRGLDVQPGDTFRTGQDGYIQLRMDDGGFISLRPSSAFVIQSYTYSPKHAERNRVQLHLQQGVVRSRTGKAGQLHKPGFSLTTPVAVIGIRGTDFTVYTTEVLSRLSVKDGGVVMAVLDPSGCTPVVPCASEHQALNAGDLGQLLEAVSGEAEVRVLNEGKTPDDMAPPHPSESVLLDEAAVRASFYTEGRVRGESAPPVNSYEEGLERVERYLSQPGLLADVWARGEAVGDEVLPGDRGLVDTPRITWGRWSQYNENTRGTKQVARLISGGHQYAAINSVFALLELKPERRPLPGSGRIHFDLNRYEAHIKRGDTLEAAGLSNAALVVDFDTSRFATRLDLHADSMPGTVPILGQGNINEQGYLSSDSGSPALINGVLAPHAEEAGYLFDYQISPGVKAVGATHWVKDKP